ALDPDAAPRPRADRPRLSAVVLPLQPEPLARRGVVVQPRALTRPRELAVAALGLTLLVAAPRVASEGAAGQDGGTGSGTGTVVGTPPKLEPIRVNKNRDVCGDSKPSEALVLSADRGVKGGVVLLEGVARGKKGAGDVVLDNSQCVFVRHVS